MVEAEKQKDAATQEALKNVEAMNNECNGIAGSSCFLFILISLSPDFFFGAWSSSPS